MILTTLITSSRKGDMTLNPNARSKINIIRPSWVPTTFRIPALIPDFNEFAMIKLTVGPGTTTTKKLAIKK